ncbi:MAG: hypothetical protein WC586_06685 [Methanoregula sp.]
MSKRACLILIIVGAGAALLFFSMQCIRDPEPAAPLLPLFIINNQDPNQTHSAQIIVTNKTGTSLFNKEYSLAPHEKIKPEIYSPTSSEDLFLTVVTDRTVISKILINASPTHVMVIEINSHDEKERISFSMIDVTPSGRHLFVLDPLFIKT